MPNLLAGARGRTRSLHPAVRLLLALGVALSIAQQWTVPDEVFFSGDGGMKALVTRQMARGDWHADLRLEADPWVAELWSEGLYPFGPPFAYRIDERWFVQYPLPFMALSTPLYRAFGFRGLTLVPLLGLWLLWFSVARLLKRLEVDWVASCIGLGGLVFASYATLYGAMFWEHAPALGLSGAGLALAFPAKAGARRSFAGGLLLGAAIWLRPESACFAAGVCVSLAALDPRARGWRWTAVGVAAAGLLFVGFNLSTYGHALGMHARQQTEEGVLHTSRAPAAAIAAFFAIELVRYCPVAILVAATTLVGLRGPVLRPGRTQAALWIVFGVFVAGTLLVVPNAGGKQIGARYFLHALVPLFLLLALQWRSASRLAAAPRRVLRGFVLAALMFGLARNTVLATRQLASDYRGGTLPALESLRADDVPVLAVEHQFMAQELESLFGHKAIFRVRDDAALNRLARAMLQREPSRFTLVSYAQPTRLVRAGDGHELNLRPRGRFGRLVLVDVSVVPRKP